MINQIGMSLRNLNRNTRNNILKGKLALFFFQLNIIISALFSNRKHIPLFIDLYSSRKHQFRACNRLQINNIKTIQYSIANLTHFSTHSSLSKNPSFSLPPKGTTSINIHIAMSKIVKKLILGFYVSRIRFYLTIPF